MGLLPSGKFDMNNCGGFSSDFIGGSQQYQRQITKVEATLVRSFVLSARVAVFLVKR